MREASSNNHSENRGRRPAPQEAAASHFGMKGLLGAVLLAMGLLVFMASSVPGPQSAFGDGPDGSPAACATDIKVDNVPDGTVVVTYNSVTHSQTGGANLEGADPNDAPITSICVKAGNDGDGGHSIFAAGSAGDSCYSVVWGAGNTSVTVTETGAAGCKDISHVDITTGTVQSNPALSITKTPSAASVAQGGTFTYSIVVTNTGDATANSVVVTDTLSGNGTITDIAVTTASSNGCETSNTFPCNFTSLAAQASITITVTVQAGSVTCDPIDNSATASATSVTGVTDNTGNQVQVTGCGPALTITKTPFAASVAQGGTFTYSIVVTNVGNATANSIVVADTLSGNGTITDIAVSTASSNGCETSNTFPCNFTSLAAQASITITVTVQAGSQTCDPIDNTATASATSVNGATDNTGNQVQVTGCGPALTITKTPSAASVAQGATFTYSIVVTNTGNATANSVVVADTLNGNGSITDIAVSTASSNACETSNTFPCNFTSLAAQASITITVTVQAGSQTCAAIDNSATASATSVNGVTDNTGNQVQVTGCDPVIGVTKTGTAAVNLLGQATYTIVIANTGSGAATNVVLTDDLPNVWFGVSGSSTSGNCSVGAGNVVTCNIGTIAANSSVTVTITAFVFSCADFTNTAVVAFGPQGQTVTANSNSVTTDVVCPPPGDNTPPDTSSPPPPPVINEVPGVTIVTTTTAPATTPPVVSQVLGVQTVPPVAEVLGSRSEVQATRLPTTGQGPTEKGTTWFSTAVIGGLFSLGLGLLIVSRKRSRREDSDL